MNNISNAKASIDFIEKVAGFLDKLKNYKPDVKSLRVNYLNKTTEMKLLLNIPQGLKRKIRGLEIPAYQGYDITEVFDAYTLNKLEIEWKHKGQNWVTDAKSLKASDKYFVIMRGAVSTEALAELVRLYCPEDPKRTKEVDLYWIDSAIKDMAILEKIYDELTVDEVSTCVRVGLERQFSSSIPKEVKQWMRAKTQVDDYLASKDRQASFRSFYKFRLAKKKMGGITASDIYNLGQRLLQPDEFMYYISADSPFRIGGLVPCDVKGLYPEKIGVTILTDLNNKRPVAQGDLIYKKLEFSSKLNEEIRSLSGLPKKLFKKKE
jgi:hypothetical protein